jgi:hypothetical protein
VRQILALVLFLVPFSPVVASASDHPGNVYEAGDDVRVEIPAAWAGGWTAVDVDGKEVGRGGAGGAGGAGGKTELGKLPVGYFEIRNKDGAERITAGVVAKNTPVDNTPIAIDAAMSWFYADPEQVRDACRLCKLAGVTWVRDRASWPELEGERGRWAADDSTRYERTMRIEHEMGLKILQVNHASPPWASKNGSRFPEDLRDAYNFYRGLAKRWKGLADAIEPWNEPDIIEFGGHTGCEIASFQKAAYLGLKAGNPDLVVNDTVFAIDRAETLEEFGANEVIGYFDRYDLHHYVRLPEYPRAYGRHRAQSGGRPMWTTEFNLTVHWADEKTKEPSEDELRVQGFRVGKVFAEALHEGPEKLFYFMLGHYVERNLQYGIVHTDFTPRPAYVAFANVGRLLNGAKPMGRVELGDEKLKGYLFRTKVNGADRETLVAWSETKPTTIEMPTATALYDYLGREMKPATKAELSRATVFFVLPPGGSKSLKLEPPPAKAKWVEGKASGVVLQLIGPTDFKQSAFQPGAGNELKLVAYNFGDKPANGKLTLDGATLVTAGVIEIGPGAREERTIKVDGGGRNVTARFESDAGNAIVAGRIAKPAPSGN